MDIGKKIVDALILRITQVCQTDIDGSDPTRAELVKRGMFQDDPEDYGVIVCVHRNDPRNYEATGDASWHDEQDFQEMGFVIGQLGAAAVEHWHRRFVVEIIVWPNADQDDADEVMNTLMARLRRTISVLNLSLSDDYGESIVIGSNPVRRMKVREGGGPDDEYSWRGYLYLEYKTVWKPT